MKKIFVNGKFLSQRITGVQRYARELLLELVKIIGKEQLNLVIPCEVKEIPRYNNINVISVGRKKGILWEQIEFPIYVKRHHGVSLNLCNVAPLISPDIVCIHDVKIKATPHFFSKKFLLWYSLLFKNETKRCASSVYII